jgi:hypothetical protein
MSDKPITDMNKMIAEIEANSAASRIRELLPKEPYAVDGETLWAKYAPRTDDRVSDLAVFLNRASDLPAGDIDKAIAVAFSDLTPAQVTEARNRAAT